MNVRLRRPNTSSPRIPVSSTGDIAFLFIVFFMATCVFSRDKGLKLLLATDTARVRNTLTVLVRTDGQVLVGEGKEPVTIQELGGIVSQELAADPKLSIALKVSREARYALMIEAFDELKMAGATRLSLVPVLQPAGEAGGRS
jgi:biopolymer transport protein ExbD